MRYLHIILTVAAAALMLGCSHGTGRRSIIYECDSFTVFTDSVVGADGVTLRPVSPEHLPPACTSTSSGQSLVDAVYNRSAAAIDSVAAAGVAAKSTRLTACSVILSLAALNPDAAMRMLRDRVSFGRLIQDSGAGGAWPVGTDRIIWAVAAWEVYAVTGDREWLAEAFEIVSRTLAADMDNILDPRYNLVHGQLSITGSLGQFYPKWMEPADIYQSMCLSVNVIYARAMKVAAMMADELGRGDASGYRRAGALIARAVNDNLWIPQRGFYGQYLYGGLYPVLSYATDNLGQALSVIFDIATPEMAESVIAASPVLPDGTPEIYPAQPETAAAASVPMVQPLWNIAAAKVKNEHALTAGLGAALRNASARGSAGNLADFCSDASAVLRILVGLRYSPDGIRFRPCVPDVLSGLRRLKGLRYRNATLDISINGSGDRIASLAIDSVEQQEFMVPASLEGRHSVDIVLANNSLSTEQNSIAAQREMPAVPEVRWDSTGLKARILNHTEGISYGVFLNGVFLDEIQQDHYTLIPPDRYTAVAFVPIKDQSTEGYTMRPNGVAPDGDVFYIYAPGVARRGTGLISDRKEAAKFVELTRDRNTRVTMDIFAPAAGSYVVDARYANGSGPVWEGDRCAVRSVYVNGSKAGIFVMPQRGTGQWTSTGFSNPLFVSLNEGKNTLEIRYDAKSDANMNLRINTALLQYIRIIRTS